ncbi:MAG: hypothetical protein GY928_39570 [Colwellia sp.]|nr:hypothetical protein [Colwellia sp.]
MYDKDLVDSLPPKVMALYFSMEQHPHVLALNHFDKDDTTFVEITFAHYSDIIKVYMNVDTHVGEVAVWYTDGDEELKGVITLKSLVALFNKLPHVDNFMEDLGTSSTRH